MKLTFKKHRLTIDLHAVVMASMIVAWALYYYFSTAAKPNGADTVLFIKPLTVALVICFFFLVFSSAKVEPGKEYGGMPAEPASGGDRGFSDPRRLFFAASLVFYAAGLTLFGYLLPSIAFVFIVCYYLGVRDARVLVGLPVVLSVLLSVVFKMMKVPIPIWPWQGWLWRG